MPAGRYIIVVAPYWNETSTQQAEYQHIRLSIYSEISI